MNRQGIPGVQKYVNVGYTNFLYGGLLIYLYLSFQNQWQNLNCQIMTNQ